MKGSTLGELFIKYEKETNPVTKSSYREIIANRLDRLESANNAIAESGNYVANKDIMGRHLIGSK